MFIDELKQIMKYKRALRHVIYHRGIAEEEEELEEEELPIMKQINKLNCSSASCIF